VNRLSRIQLLRAYLKSWGLTIAAEAIDRFLGLSPTPSQRATVKYFFVVAALWVVQVALGAIAAHYGVEGGGFYGIPLGKWLPYSVTRTWHLQIGIFWIATSWLATGLYIVPAVSGIEPKGQRLGVNALFVAVVAVVVGSLAGEWLGIQQKLGNLWFWFGSQGYEYVDLGRVWQILLFVGLTFWLWLMWRGLRLALARRDENYSLLMLFLISSIAIPLFYAAGLMYGQRSPLITAEYWRWWVVHLWVEGFFEVFATVVIAFLLTRLKLPSITTATRGVLFSTVIYLSGGIMGTFHHLYFTGTPNSVLALGAIFSALEVVPLVLIGFEAWENIRLSRGSAHNPWISAYKWPIYFFVAVAFWNFVGAGLFWLHDQSSDRALLRARTEPHSSAWTHCSVRGVRRAGAGINVVLPARPPSWADVEGSSSRHRVLVHQHRARGDGSAQYIADRSRPSLGIG